MFATMLHQETVKSGESGHHHLEPRSNAWKIGMWMSLLCAVHCAALPLLLVMAPAIGSRFFASDLLEWLLIGFAMIFAIWSITRGYLKEHHKRLPGVILAVVAGKIFLPDNLEPIAGVIGSLGIAAAQFINLRLVKRFHRCAVHH
jgi:hypothetical protein